MNLDLKRKELELRRVSMAKDELELKILEREDEITRLRAHIKIQEDTEVKLQKQINELKKI